MKRVLCLISNMNAGGAETFLMKLFRRLDKEQYQMDFCINIQEKCYYEDEIINLGGRVFRIPPRTKQWFKHNSELAKILNSEHYECVLVISSNSTGYLDLKLAKKYGIKNRAIRSSNSKCSDNKVIQIIHLFGKKYWNKYANIKIAPSDLAAEHLFGTENIISNQVVFLRNGLDIDAYRFNKVNRVAVREELGIQNDVFVIGHIGRFYHQKNHTFLIDIFSNIVKKRSNSILLLIGSGQLEDNIRLKVEKLGLTDKVLFLGTRQDIPRLLSGMDSFVFPSLYEGMPNTVIEAQANGLPCILSDSITKEVGLLDSTKFVSLNISTEDWANIIIDIGENMNRDTNNIMVEAGYSIDQCVEQFCKIIYS